MTTPSPIPTAAQVEAALLPCPWCGAHLVYVESWAKSFNPPRLYHEFNHPKNDCKFPLRFSFNDDPQPRQQFVCDWNSRVAIPSPGADKARIAELEAEVAATRFLYGGVQDRLGFICDELLLPRGSSTEDIIAAIRQRSPQPQPAPGPGVVVPEGWQSINSAPKTGVDMVALPFEGWCPDEEAPNGGDIRIIWWEPKLRGGCWWSDRDLPEHPTLWRALRPAPPVRPSSERGQ